MKLRSLIEAGATQRELLSEYDVTSGQLKVVDCYYTYLEPNKRVKPNVTWIYGSTGTGKTRYADQTYKDIFWKDSTKWWDGYEKHETIVLDDFRPKNMEFDELLRVLDRYPKRLEIKGGFRWLNSPNIIITSNKSSEQLYHYKTDEDINQLLRRIDIQINMDDPNGSGSQQG